MFERHPFPRAIFLFIRCWTFFLAAFLILYLAWLRQWQMTWGATEEDVSRYMAGDELLEDPAFNATRAVAIKATPERIWPWIVQMGYKRAGFYGFDRLDNSGIPSAQHIIPEYQNLKVGDLISLGGFFVKVVQMEPNKSMLWVFQEEAGPWQNATWSWGLYPIDDKRTRLVSRLRQKYSFGSLQEAINWALIDTTEIFMMRTCLLGIKHRVEGH